MNTFFKSKTKRLMALMALMVLIFVVVRQYRSHHVTETINATPVIVTQPVKKSIRHTVSVVGSIIATQQTNITPKTAGYISHILFTEGQVVKANTPVIQLDDTKIRAQVAADLVAYHISLTQYQLDQRVFKKGLITKPEMESEHANMASKLAQLTQDQELLDEMTLRAPFDGTLGAKTVSIGDYVNAAQSLVLLVDRDHLQVEYNLPEKYAASLKLGTMITLTSQTEARQTYPAKINYIAPNLNIINRTIMVHAIINDPQHQLLPGQYVMIQQTLNKPILALFVPEQAIIPTLDNNQLFIVTNNKAHSVVVTLGSRQAGLVEIKQGINAKDWLVTEGQHQLKEGQAVAAQRAKTS